MTEDRDVQDSNVSHNQSHIDSDLVQGDKIGGDKIGGDKIGGDKFVITNPTTYKYLSRKDVVIILLAITAIMMGAVLLFKALPNKEQEVIVAEPVTVSEIENPVVVIQSTDMPTPIPSATAEPFEPAAEGEALIVVLPFTSDDRDDIPDIHRRIQSDIEDSITDLTLTSDVRVEINPNVALHRDDREDAQALGERYGAAVIIWGTKTDYDVTVRFLNIKALEIPAGDEQVQIVAPDEFAEFVVRDLPNQLTFLSLFAVGQAVVAEGRLTAAIPIMETAVNNISEQMIAEELTTPEAATDAYFRLGWLYHVPPTQNFQQAAGAYEQSLVFDPENPDSLGNLGAVYFALGEYEKAINYHEQALAIAKSNGDKDGEAAGLGNLGIIYRSLGEYETAVSHFEQVLVIARTSGDKGSEGMSLNQLGSVYRFLGDYDTATHYHEQALAIFQLINDKTGEGNALGNLGIIYRSLGDYETAVSYMEQALAIAQEIGDKENEGIQLGNLGLVYGSVGEYEIAMGYHEQALAIALAIGDKAGEASQLGNLGSAHRFLGEYETAVDYLEQSLTITQEIGYKAGEASNLYEIGLIYRSLGEYKTAVSHLEQALSISQSIGDKAGEGDQLFGLGGAYYYMEEYETAVLYFEQALVIFQEIGSPRAAQTQELLDAIQTEINGG